MINLKPKTEAETILLRIFIAFSHEYEKAYKKQCKMSVMGKIQLEGEYTPIMEMFDYIQGRFPKYFKSKVPYPNNGEWDHPKFQGTREEVIK